MGGGRGLEDAKDQLFLFFLFYRPHHPDTSELSKSLCCSRRSRMLLKVQTDKENPAWGGGQESSLCKNYQHAREGGGGLRAHIVFLLGHGIKHLRLHLFRSNLTVVCASLRSSRTGMMVRGQRSGQRCGYKRSQ